MIRKDLEVEAPKTQNKADTATLMLSNGGKITFPFFMIMSAV
jgi:hypothetical protein